MLPSAPSGLKQSSRTATRVVLEWQVDQSSIHGRAHKCIIRNASGQILADVDRPGLFSWGWRVKLEGLQPNKEEEISVVAIGAAGEGHATRIRASTCTLPLQPFHLRQVEETATSLCVSWAVADPVDAAVERCIVQLGDVFTEVRRPWGHQPHQRWSLSLSKPSKVQLILVKAVNAIGEGPVGSLPAQTLPLPPAPAALCQTGRDLSSATVQWTVLDPEGAAVQTCKIRMGTQVISEVTRAKSLSWAGTWIATIPFLEPSSRYTLSVAATNAVGEGPQTLKSIETWQLPQAPRALKQTDHCLTSVRIQWKVADPLGVPVKRCFVKLGEAVLVTVERLLLHSSDGFWFAEVPGLQANTDSLLRLAAANEVGTGCESNLLVSTCRLPSQPSQLKLNQVVDSPAQVRVSWLVGDPVGAPVQKCSVRVGDVVVNEVSRPWGHVSHQHWQAIVAKSSQPEQIFVSASNAVGQGPFSCIRALTLGHPQAPSEFSQTSRGVSSVGLRWHVEDPPGAKVHSCKLMFEDKILVLTRANKYNWMSSRWATDVSQLQPSKEYVFAVAAVNSVGVGICSRIRACTVHTPSPPTEICQTGPRHLTNVTLSWKEVDPPSGPVLRCIVEIDLEEDWCKIVVVERNDSYNIISGCWCATLSDLQPAWEYNFVVSAINAAGCGPSSHVCGCTVHQPLAPSELRQNRMDLTSVQLAWKVEDPGGGKVHHCIIQSETGLLVEVGRDEAYYWMSKTWFASIPDLEPSQEYMLRVAGVNDAGEGAGRAIGVMTLSSPKSPGNMEQVQRSLTTVTVQWKVADPPGAKVQRCLLRLESKLVAEVIRPWWHHSDQFWSTKVEGLQDNQSIRLVISAVNEVGEGGDASIHASTLCSPDAPQELTQLESEECSGPVIDLEDFRGGTTHVEESSDASEYMDFIWGLSGIERRNRLCGIANTNHRQTRGESIKVDFRWVVIDPPEAPVQKCIVCLGARVMAEVSRPPGPNTSNHLQWRTSIARPSEVMELSVAAVNSVGRGPVSTIRAWTIHRPKAPYDFQQIARSPSTVALQWRVVDPPCMEIKSCILRNLDTVLAEVHRPNTQGTSSASSAPFGSPHTTQNLDNTWHAVISNLSANQKMRLHVTATNAVEEGPECNGIALTSVSPSAPLVEQIDRSPTSVVLRWIVEDPEGAPVEQCIILQEDRLPEVVATVPRSDRWQCVIPHLRPASTIFFNVMGVNASGTGAPGSLRAHTSTPPAAPFVKQTHRSPKSLTIKWDVDDPLGAPVDSCFVELEGDASKTVHRRKDLQWQATFKNLEHSQTFYAIVSPTNGAGVGSQKRIQVQTSTRPPVPQVEQVDRSATSVTLHWVVRDPLGAPVQKCTVCLGRDIAVEVDRPSGHRPDSSWRAVLPDLFAAQSVSVAVAATNAVGMGPESRMNARTSDAPAAARMAQSERSPSSLVLQWWVDDPMGEPVETCTVWLGDVSRTMHRQAGLNTEFGRSWTAEFGRLRPEKMLWACVIASNAVGEGPESWLKVYTSCRPAAPHGEQHMCSARSVTLKWTVEDPLGAPVEKCCLWLGSRLVEEVHQPVRSNWQTTIQDLQPAQKLSVRVAAVNAVGQGNSSIIRACTSKPPGSPWIDQKSSTTTSITFTWTVDDPIGAPVDKCKVDLGDHGGAVVVWRRQGWEYTISNLRPAERVLVSVTAINDAGEGRSKEYFVYTSRFDRRDGKVYEMFHGTDPSAARSIQQGGFRPSTGGMLGAGVYLSRDVRKARGYGSIVLKCVVNVGKVKCINYQGHPLQKSWHQNGYDTAWVPPNCGMVSSGLEEDCVYDPKRIRIVGVAPQT